jgi:hypothetical protein
MQLKADLDSARSELAKLKKSKPKAAAKPATKKKTK